MTLSEIQQQRLLFWAERLLVVSAGGAPLDQREVDALRKLVGTCRPVLYPEVKLPPGMPKKLD